jgi:hypothetical protein
MSRRFSRYNHRDANEPELLKCLARLGVDWNEGSPLDGWVFLGQWIPVEIKTQEGRLTKDQKDFIAYCQATGRPFLVWRSLEDVLKSVRFHVEQPPKLLGAAQKPDIRAVP